MELAAGIAVAATIVLYILFYAFIVSSALDRIRDTVAGVVAKRAGGVIILGGGSLLATVLLTPYSPADLGLTPFIPPSTWLWVGGATVAVLIGCVLTAHKPGNFEMYPEMRLAGWGAGALAANLVSCAAYMLAYEYLFRGFLFFACLAVMPVWAAIAVNVALYALAHVPKGPREAIGAIPLGIILCLSAVETGAIWAAFLIHVVMSQMNDWFAVRANPAMRFGRAG